MGLSAMREDFSGFFGDFETFFHDSNIKGYDVYFFLGEDTFIRQKARIIGVIENEPVVGTMLLYVPMEDSETDRETDELVEERGVCIITLQSALRYGIRVIPHGNTN